MDGSGAMLRWEYIDYTENLLTSYPVSSSIGIEWLNKNIVSGDLEAMVSLYRCNSWRTAHDPIPSPRRNFPVVRGARKLLQPSPGLHERPSSDAKSSILSCNDGMVRSRFFHQKTIL